MTEYTEKVIEHFKNPRNVGIIENASGKGVEGSPICGDIMELYIRVDGAGRISDAKFKTFGCGAAIASSSMLTEIIKGKTIEEAQRFSNNEIVKALGGLPAEKIHCSVLAEGALKKAIEDYHQKVGKDWSKKDGK